MWIQTQSKMKSTQLKHTSNKQLITKTMKKQLSTAIKLLSLEKAKKEAEENHTEDSATVTVKDMQRIVEERTNIPVGDLQKQEENQLRDLDKKLDDMLLVKPKQWIRLPVPFVVTGLV